MLMKDAIRPTLMQTLEVLPLFNPFSIEPSSSPFPSLSIFLSFSISIQPFSSLHPILSLPPFHSTPSTPPTSYHLITSHPPIHPKPSLSHLITSSIAFLFNTPLYPGFSSTGACGSLCQHRPRQLLHHR